MRQISVKDMAYPGFGENPGLADVDVYTDEVGTVLILLRDQDRHGGPSVTNALERVAKTVHEKILSLLHLEASPKIWLTWSRVDKLVFKVHFEDPIRFLNPIWTYVDEEELRAILIRFHALEDFHRWVQEGSIEVVFAKRPEPTHKMVEVAKALAQERNTEGLRALMRMAVLGVQKMHLWHWAEPEKPIGGNLEQALHPSLVRWAVMNGARPENLGERVVDLKRVAAVTAPQDALRVLETLRRAGEGYREAPESTQALIYAPMGVLFFAGDSQYGGALAVLQGGGRVRASVVDMSPYYEKGLSITWGPLGPVAWLRGRAFALPEDYGMLLALGRVLWEEGIDLVREAE
uniref:Uncharacterized protein n=1 Tax=Thermus caliditerrae TaxID=1330700 RepID=A0A7C5RER0_9DEIN